MARAPRVDVGGYAYHVLNRTAGRWRMFKKDGDFEAFERVLEQAVERARGSGGDVKLLTYCLMGNHWHLVLKTEADGVLGPFMQWLTTTHAGRYRVAQRAGVAALYQGRFKSFLIQSDAHLLTVCRYVERNAARAGLAGAAGRAEDWRWSGLWRWKFGDAEQRAILSDWPVRGVTIGSHGRPRNWLRTANTPLSEPELEALRTAANRCSPYGSERWRERMVRSFGLESTVRRPGRPKLVR